MTAVAALYNRDMPDDTAINLYYNTATAQLGCVLKNSTNGTDPSGKTFQASADDYTGYIVNPSEIACGTYHGFNVVVGATVPRTEGGNRPTSNQISVLSPVYMGLATTGLQNAKVTMSASETNAWVYYLDGSANNQMKLKEYTYTTGNVSSYLEGADIMLNSSLGAWYESATDQRCVLYQRLSTFTLKEFNVTTRDTRELVNADSPRVPTTIAVTYYRGNTYAYYADTQNRIRRVIKSGGEWGSSTILQNSPPIGTGQLTVATANGLNHLLYMARDDSFAAQDFTHYTDPVQ